MLKWRSLVRRCRRNMRFLIIFSCILLMSNSMFSRAKHTLVSFSKTSNCTRPSDWCNFDRLWKTHSCMFFFQIALETILLPIQTRQFFKDSSLRPWPCKRMHRSNVYRSRDTRAHFSLA